MAVSLAIIFLFGIISHQLFVRLRLPGFLGILFLGMAIGPYGADWIDDSILLVSADLRNIALVIILLRAGLGLNLQTLKMVGMPALRLGFIPALVEGTMVMVIAAWLLDITLVEAGMLGFIIAAVSPAVIVPKMLSYIELGKGADKGIPAMILAGASLDDVVAITIFSSFAGYYAGTGLDIAGQIFIIPISIITGVLAGAVVGIALLFLFKHFNIRHTKKILVILASAIFLTHAGNMLRNIIPLASLLGVMVIGFVMLERRPSLAIEMSARYSKIWVFAEILLFFLVGAEVNFLLAGEAGLTGLIIIFAGLIARVASVYFSLAGTNLSLSEKGFCMLAYSPKATVQAAIGSVPLAMGAPAGETILILAVLAIVITAPLGAISMNIAGEKVLKGKMS
jgi:solute carrier family 9B (sodium/hydrogen exchanger), member 1/2